MASLYVPSRAGSPISAGAKLYFYQTGTTTPLDTFSQSDLAPGHENTNPVVADSNGLFGPIYLKPTPDYKAILTNAAGTTIWTTDPLLTAASSVITTQGDLIVGDSNGAASRLAIGADAHYLRSNATTASWHTLDAADLNGTTPKANMPAGSIVQSVVVSTNAYSTHVNVIPYDDTIPQIGEGDLLLTGSITPTTTSNRVRVTALINTDAGADAAIGALFRNGGANALATAASFGSADATDQLALEYDDVPGSVSAQSYTLRVGPSTTLLAINGIGAGRKFGGTMISSLRLEEIVV